MFIPADAGKATANCVLLDHVERVPERRGLIGRTARQKKLTRLDRRIHIAILVAKAQNHCAFRHRIPLFRAHGDLGPFHRGLQKTTGRLQHFESAVDDLFCHVAGMAHLDGVDGRSLRNQRVEALDAEEAGHQVISRSAVIGILQDDFQRGIADAVLALGVDLAQADHVLGEIPAIIQPGDGLSRGDGLKAFLHDTLQDFPSRDGLEAIRTRRVSFDSEDRRRELAQFVFAKSALMVVEAGALGVQGTSGMHDIPLSVCGGRRNVPGDDLEIGRSEKEKQAQSLVIKICGKGKNAGFSLKIMLAFLSGAVYWEHQRGNEMSGMFAKIEGQAVGAIVDQLGRLQAQIADLEAGA